jgi:hypothetical protein
MYLIGKRDKLHSLWDENFPPYSPSPSLNENNFHPAVAQSVPSEIDPFLTVV